MLSERFEMRFTVDLLTKVDEWRRTQPDLPARAEAIRRLIEAGLGAAGTRGGPRGGNSPAVRKKATTGKRAPAPKAKALTMSKEAQIRALREQGLDEV